MTLQDVGILFAVFVAFIALASALYARWQGERDARYYEYWMRSLEQRKIDSPEFIEERKRVFDDQEP